MAIRCDICGRLSPDRSVSCECGYQFETGAFDDSVALERAYQHQQRAGSEIARGVVMLLLTPIVSILAVAAAALFDTLAPLVVGGLLDVLLALGGVGSMGMGIVRRLQAGRELRVAEERRQLPAARVIT